MSAEQASNSVSPDTEAGGPAGSEAGSVKSGKRRRRLGPARAQAKAKTRKALLDAAEMLFIQEGFDQPGLDVICSVAGRTRGAYNVHFGSREHLVEAVALRALEIFEAELMSSQALVSLESPATLARLPVDSPPQDEEPDRRLPMPLILHAASRIPAVREAVLDTFQRIRRYLGEMAAQRHTAGELRFDAAPSSLAPMLLAIRVGLELLESVGSQRLEIDRPELRELLETVLRP